MIVGGGVWWRLVVTILLFLALFNHPDLRGFDRLVNSIVILFCLNELFVNRAEQEKKHYDQN